MKMSEFIQTIKDAGGVYNRDAGLFDLWCDLEEGLEEGYIEGITIADRRKNGNGVIEGIRARCEDGVVWVKKGDEDGLSFKRIPDHEADYTRPVPCRRATPYERTRAAVYARGNKWQIENFNATHC